VPTFGQSADGTEDSAYRRSVISTVEARPTRGPLLDPIVGLQGREERR